MNPTEKFEVGCISIENRNKLAFYYALIVHR